MNAYFVVSIQQVGETTPTTINGYETKEAALSAYHSTLASNYISETLDAFTVVLLNGHGGTELREYWEKTNPPTPGPEPEEVVEPAGE